MNKIVRYIYLSAIPRKRFGSVNCDTMYTIYPSLHKQLIRTLFEAHIVLNSNNSNNSKISLISFVSAPSYGSSYSGDSYSAKERHAQKN